jgi:spore coat protein A
MRKLSQMVFERAPAVASSFFILACGSNPDPAMIERVASVSQASVRVPQLPLDGAAVTKYVDALPLLSGSRVDGTATVSVDMREFQQKVLPASFYADLPRPFDQGSFLWGYSVNRQPPSWPSRTIEARRRIATTVIYTNGLQQGDGSPPVLAAYLTQDLTIHWADPLGITRANGCTEGPPLSSACTRPYVGPIPAVTHLHGAEDLSQYDGHPDAWFTPGFALKGPAYITNTYNYPNQQPATTLWFHDHAVGMTRLNVYSGLAGFYLIRDGRDTGAVDNAIHLPAGPFEQELLISDRQFDTNGQVLFPDGTPPENPTGLNGSPPNPDVHPFWIPEFFGDVIAVNGKAWPYMRVEPRRYRFRVLNSSNARFYQMQLMKEVNGRPVASPGPAIWQIGSDGGFLDAPTNVDNPNNPASPHLFLAPAERADVIVDFAGQSGRRFILANLPTAVAPFPSGDPPDPNTSGQVMEFRVDLPLSGRDRSFNPAAPKAELRTEPIVDIKPTRRHPPDRVRQLILVEIEGEGGPEMLLLNNTHWDGLRSGTTSPVPGSVANGFGLHATENPQEGATEVWEIANLTEDAHPIHVHLVQFQLINRQPFRRDDYRVLWDSRFPGGTFNGTTYPGGVFIPGFGPPLDYGTPNEARALGGNPAFNPFLDGDPVPPQPSEAGWKDTIKVRPLEVTRLALRWAPLDVPLNAVHAGENTFPFDPTTGGPGYIWHCHMLDHEDNEMMRPYLVAK